jgi:hypothetical protein
MNIVNLTPHKINIFNEDNEEITVIDPSGIVAKIGTKRKKIATVLSIPFFLTEIEQPEGLPEPAEGTIYIVSGMFRSHVDRPDLYQPGELLRDDEGRPIGCIGLSQ